MTENIRGEQLGGPVSGLFHHGLVADDASVHDQSVEDPVKVATPARTESRSATSMRTMSKMSRPVAAWRSALCLCRSIHVAARKVDPRELRTDSQLPGYLLADSDVGTRNECSLSLELAHSESSSSFVGAGRPAEQPETGIHRETPNFDQLLVLGRVVPTECRLTIGKLHDHS